MHTVVGLEEQRAVHSREIGGVGTACSEVDIFDQPNTRCGLRGAHARQHSQNCQQYAQIRPHATSMVMQLVHRFSSRRAILLSHLPVADCSWFVPLLSIEYEPKE